MKKHFVLLAFIFFFYSLISRSQVYAQSAQPDLTPTKLELTDVNGNVKNTFLVGENIYVSVTIQNLGGQSPDPGSNSTYETFYKNRQSQVNACKVSSDPSDFYLHNGLFSAQQISTWQSFPSGTKSYLFPVVKSWTMSTPGQYTAWVYVDYDCQIAESNENNNQTSVSYTVVSTAPVATNTSTQIPTVALQVTPLSTSIQPLSLGASTELASEGAWIKDPEVTTIGKNASRSGMLLDWTLRDYKWASSSAYTDNPLVPFWLIIQRIVYALFLFVILVTAFILIITRGRSLSAKRFLPRFFLVVLLVTFSFSLVQFLYQIIDIFQGFFLKNPAGSIISSHDLLFIGFDYRTFEGLRVFGENYNESAFTSLLLVKLTSFTYYVMAIMLIFRKIILWFLIIISPVFPILLLFYPLRNTAKIWIGEFFRWLLYAPLFAIFLSGLVRLWHAGLPLLFNYTGVGNSSNAIYPTAVNILLGGPGQNISLNNSVNLPDTFALYLVALLMLWVVILLPFILLQIFLDYMMAFNYKDNPFIKQVYTMLNNRPVTPFRPIPPTPPPAFTGLARNLPFTRRFEMPKTTGLARALPTSTSQSIQRPITSRISNRTEISRFTNLSIPTMRDIARFETTKLSHDIRSQQEIERTRQALIHIANPASTSSVTERERIKVVRDRLLVEGQKGNLVATNILNAATTYNAYTSQSSQSSLTQQTTQMIQNLSKPTTIISKRDQQKFVQIKEELTKAASSGNQFAQTVLNSVNSYTTNQITQLQQLLSQIAHPEKITNTSDKEKYTTLREKIMTASKSGNSLATLLSSSLETATSQEQVKKIQDQLIEAKAQGNPLATELLQTLTSSDKTSEKDLEKLHETLTDASKKGDPLATLLLKTLGSQQEKAQAAPVSATAKLKAGTFPQVNRIQQVSLDDYEAVKKMWKDNYQKVDVPQSQTGQQTRKEWITQDVAGIEETISLLSSTNPQEVEAGMQQVSDILPFLLIGGFSQTEIIAYLKAKLEAGKAVIEETGSKDEEEDTLLSASHAAQTASLHLTTAAEINEGDSITSNSTITNNYQTSQVKEVEVPSTATDTKLLQLVQLPLVTMQDIARFESSTKSQKEANDMQKVQATLGLLAHPENITSNEEREKFTKLREKIVEENKKGNPLAGMIIAATDQASSLPKTLSEKDALSFIHTLQSAANPNLVSDSASLSDYQKVSSQLVASRAKADVSTLALLQVLSRVNEIELERTKEFLQRISNPTSMATAPEQIHYNKLVERIGQASADGNQSASFILKTAREKLTEEKVAQLYHELTSASEKGDALATYISSSLYSLPQEVITSVNTVYQQLLKEKSGGNTVAQSLLRLFAKQQRSSQNEQAVVQSFPTKNRIQQVSLEDYEAVKKMWTDNYQSSSVTDTITREEWIKHDMTSVDEAINLLSSSNAEDIEQGKEKVGEILPFLLLGGFSQSEIVGYLRAKQAAGKSVLEQLTNDDSDEMLTSSSAALVTKEPLHMSAVVDSPAPQADQGDTVASHVTSEKTDTTHYRLPIPSLLEIAAYETHTKNTEKDSVHQLQTLLTKMVNPQQVQIPEERKELSSLHQTLMQESAKGDSIAQLILSAVEKNTPMTAGNNTQTLLMTLEKIVDPSLVPATEQPQEYRQAREELIKARQEGNQDAVMIMKLIDKVAQFHTESVMKFLQYLSNPLQLTNEIDQAKYSQLKEQLEAEKTQNPLANSIISVLHTDITPVSANKVRVQLLEGVTAGNNVVADQLMQTFITLPQTTIKEITSLYQQLTEKKTSDPFVAQLLRLLSLQNKGKRKTGAAISFPKQNRVQKVNSDDYEAIKRMLYEMYVHGQVPRKTDGSEQTRKEWILSDKKEVENVINLLTSDISENAEKATEMLGSILPFLLIGGFSHEEVIGYLKAKKEACSMALQVVQDSEPDEVISAQVRKTEENNTLQAEAGEESSK